MSVRSKNPLHPSALSLNKMTVGRPIICQNTEFGVVVEGTIIRAPYIERVVSEDDGEVFTELTIDIVNQFGDIEPVELVNIGVIPYNGSNSDPDADWHEKSFTIDARKRALLPRVIVDNSPYSDSYFSLDYPFDTNEDYFDLMTHLNSSAN